MTTANEIVLEDPDDPYRTVIRWDASGRPVVSVTAEVMPGSEDTEVVQAEAERRCAVMVAWLESLVRPPEQPR